MASNCALDLKIPIARFDYVRCFEFRICFQSILDSKV